MLHRATHLTRWHARRSKLDYLDKPDAGALVGHVHGIVPIVEPVEEGIGLGQGFGERLPLPGEYGEHRLSPGLSSQLHPPDSRSKLRIAHEDREEMAEPDRVVDEQHVREVP